MNQEINKNYNNKLLRAMQLINVFIGVIIALICVFAYITIESLYVRGIIIVFVISFGIICFVKIHKSLHKEEAMQDESNISSIDLVNEDNEIIKKWNVGEKISFIIGKNTTGDDVFVDLNCSIYSNFIEANHAVMNYAAGKWYIEDLSDKSGVIIQKSCDNKKYRIVKDAPCELKKGDIIFISKVKLLLK